MTRGGTSGHFRVMVRACTNPPHIQRGAGLGQGRGFNDGATDYMAPQAAGDPQVGGWVGTVALHP